jgi:hypothetical protein
MLRAQKNAKTFTAETQRTQRNKNYNNKPVPSPAGVRYLKYSFKP